MRFLWVLTLTGLAPLALAGQSHQHPGPALSWGAQAIPLLTHATPADRGRSLTEGYLSQPNLFGNAWLGPLSAQVTLNLEGLTLRRGELNAGTWGEGYVDRRHPHTYVHEAVASLNLASGNARASITAGRGFAPFGTDDPMSRPFLKFPANHHMAQVLERLILIGAVRYRAVGVEAGLINGDEPLEPSSLGSLDRLGDSWTARVTVRPYPGYEFQASHAALESPEQPLGNATDQRKWDVSVRVARDHDERGHYLLLEWARTSKLSGGSTFLTLDSFLGEGSLRRGPWRAGLRVERTMRPEEERSGSIFRSLWPHTDDRIWGLTRWVIATGNLSRTFSLLNLGVAPVLEVSRQWAQPATQPALFTPQELYGSGRLWSVTLGVRLTAGSSHERMGRYGAAQCCEDRHVPSVKSNTVTVSGLPERQ